MYITKNSFKEFNPWKDLWLQGNNFFLPLCDSRVFLIRNFWKNERPSSTEYETATENSYNLKNETDTEISETKSEQPTETIENQINNLELSKIELKSENRKLEYRINRFQEKLARLTTENGAAEDIRIQMENELVNCKSRIDQLESGNRLLEMQKNKYQLSHSEIKRSWKQTKRKKMHW